MSELCRLEITNDISSLMLPYTVVCDNHSYNSKNVVDWIERNCRGIVSSKYSLFFFEFQEDSVLFELTWC